VATQYGAVADWQWNVDSWNEKVKSEFGSFHWLDDTIYYYYLLCNSYQGTRKVMQKNREKKHLTRCIYIVHNRLYVWPRKPTGQCCLTISDKYTLKQQINFMHLNFSNLRPCTRMYIIRYKSRIICKNVGNIKTVSSWAVQNITFNKWKFSPNLILWWATYLTRLDVWNRLQSSLTFYKLCPIQVDTDLATEAGSGESYGVNPKLYKHLFSMRYKNLTTEHTLSPTARSRRSSYNTKRTNVIWPRTGDSQKNRAYY